MERYVSENETTSSEDKTGWIKSLFRKTKVALTNPATRNTAIVITGGKLVCATMIGVGYYKNNTLFIAGNVLIYAFSIKLIPVYAAAFYYGRNILGRAKPSKAPEPGVPSALPANQSVKQGN